MIGGFVFSLVPVRLFLNISAVVLFSSSFGSKRPFCISQKCDVTIRIFENKNNPEFSNPPLQQFSITEASNSTFVLCRKVMLCQSGRMAHRDPIT